MADDKETHAADDNADSRAQDGLNDIADELAGRVRKKIDEAASTAQDLFGSISAMGCAWGKGIATTTMKKPLAALLVAAAACPDNRMPFEAGIDNRAVSRREIAPPMSSLVSHVR